MTVCNARIIMFEPDPTFLDEPYESGEMYIITGYRKGKSIEYHLNEKQVKNLIESSNYCNENVYVYEYRVNGEWIVSKFIPLDYKFKRSLYGKKCFRKSMIKKYKVRALA